LEIQSQQNLKSTNTVKTKDIESFALRTCKSVRWVTSSPRVVAQTDMCREMLGPHYNWWKL